ncbi:efflux RND transporter periplasmic adaptor subunit [Alkalimarinus alittae]|uniref:Efflux RND transporter periplasmic adaptor subunit n=1 Tax=Alkalimarinus alittae TaxID=2961619 RepID=A0ABY6N6B4_9ALTE|nr:efflux RND transporter periplasmic adaptor subunit [Alkalimarinus alittae]UZE97658.1 efflux RND transporter periplasmic adaptor subunit [Alkalimarinus alittae]
MHYQRFIPLVISLALMGCGQEETGSAKEIIQPAKIMIVKGASNEVNRQLPGTVRASQRVNLSFQVPGQLKFFPVKEGQKVLKGEVLGRLDDRDYRSNLSAARADLINAESNFKRAEGLLVKKFISKAEYDKLKAALDVARSNSEKAEKALDDAELKAPFTGTIAKRYVENFQDVQAKQAVISLQDISQLEVVINISESLVSRRNNDKDSLKVSATFDAFPDEQFDLFVKEFSTEADSNTQTFEVVLGMNDTKGIALLPGMTAKVMASKVNTDAVSSTYLLPLHAVVADEDSNAFVWVVDKSSTSVTKKPVVMGALKGSSEIEVTGIDLGDMVVVGGVTKMREGKIIRPIEKVAY